MTDTRYCPRCLLDRFTFTPLRNGAFKGHLIAMDSDANLAYIQPSTSGGALRITQRGVGSMQMRSFGTQ